MKKIILSGFLLMISHFLSAQIQNPVDWTVSSKKIADKTYEIHLTATINAGMFIHRQLQTGDLYLPAFHLQKIRCCCCREKQKK